MRAICGLSVWIIDRVLPPEKRRFPFPFASHIECVSRYFFNPWTLWTYVILGVRTWGRGRVGARDRLARGRRHCVRGADWWHRQQWRSRAERLWSGRDSNSWRSRYCQQKVTRPWCSHCIHFSINICTFFFYNPFFYVLQNEVVLGLFHYSIKNSKPFKKKKIFRRNNNVKDVSRFVVQVSSLDLYICVSLPRNFPMLSGREVRLAAAVVWYREITRTWSLQRVVFCWTVFSAWCTTSIATGWILWPPVPLAISWSEE